MAKLKNPVTAADHAQGHANAPVTLVEYGDYECPHCRVAHATVRRLEKHFGDKLRFVFRNFPLTQIHPDAQPAAEVAEFAARLGKFWEMNDLLFENQNRLGSKLYMELAEQLGLDAGALLSSLDNGEQTERVRTDFTGGVRSGVNGTPTFFINGDRHNGAPEYDSLVAAINTATDAAPAS